MNIQNYNNRDILSGNRFTHIDQPIAISPTGGTVTWADMIDFGNVTFDYTDKQISGSWYSVLELIQSLITRINELEHSTPDPVTQYTVRLTLNGGTTTSTNPQSVISGRTVTFELVPDSGKKLPTSIAGCSINGNILTVSNVTENKNITVTFPDDNASITITKGTLSGNVQTFTVKSTKTGTLSLSTTAGTLNKNSISMTANQNENFTLTGNTGANATAPIITITQGTMGTNSCTFTVKSTVAGTLSLSTSAGSLNKTSLSMTANTEQTVTITNNGTSAINPTITASQTVNGSTGQTINYTITATQTVNSVLSSATFTGSINGTTGQSATGTKALTINNIPGIQQTNYYFYVGTSKPTSLSQASTVTSYPTEQTYTNNSGAKSHIFVLTNSGKTVTFINPELNSPVSQLNVDTTTISGYSIFETAVGTANGKSIKINIS